MIKTITKFFLCVEKKIITEALTLLLSTDQYSLNVPLFGLHSFCTGQPNYESNDQPNNQPASACKFLPNIGTSSLQASRNGWIGTLPSSKTLIFTKLQQIRRTHSQLSNSKQQSIIFNTSLSPSLSLSLSLSAFLLKHIKVLKKTQTHKAKQRSLSHNFKILTSLNCKEWQKMPQLPPLKIHYSYSMHLSGLFKNADFELKCIRTCQENRTFSLSFKYIPL